MNAITKQEIHEIIDTLPDYKLEVIRPLLLLVSNEYEDDELTPEEAAEMKQYLEDYEKDPSSFIPLEEVLAKHRAQGLDV
jgi:hypothetical protein